MIYGRFTYARNWDDFLQRDVKAMTFPRAFGVFTATTLFFLSATSILVRLMPLGRFGIRSIKQTSFYHNFGPAAVALAFAGWGAGIKYKLSKLATSSGRHSSSPSTSSSGT